MRVISPQLEAHFGSGLTTLATCWRLTRQDNTELGFTDHDRALVIDSLEYDSIAGFTPTTVESKSNMSVDNLDLEGQTFPSKITESDLLAGMYDYLNQRDDRGNSIIVVDPIRGALIRKFFIEYASGAYTLSDMQRRCQEWGLTTKTGKVVGKSSLYRTVQNPFYYGEMLIKGQIMQHCHEPLISKNVWEDCQGVLDGWAKKPFLYGGKDYLFRGLLTCAATGRVISSDTKKRTYQNGNTAEWTYLVTWNHRVAIGRSGLTAWR